MDEYAASYSCIEKIVNAVQCMKECLICRICLELFKEPVTIKCGHKFCRKCILQVTNAEHATCPFCNIKIQKRSIPRKGNVLLESVIVLFHNLTQAIRSDSGLNALEPFNNSKHTKESVAINEKLNTFNSEHELTTSAISSSKNETLKKSMVDSKSNKKSNSRKKQVQNRQKNRDTENSFNKYLSKEQDYDVSNPEVPTEEKVKSWLKNITPDSSLKESNCHENTNSNIEIANENNEATAESPTSLLKESHECSATNINKKKVFKLNSNKYSEKQQKPKKNQSESQVSDTMNINKKSNQILPNKNVLKSASVSVTSHSDSTCGWRRVKRVGKEMQPKNFKSLNVSIEKNSSSATLDDTVPCNSSNNNTKSISRETLTNNYSSNDISSSKRKSLEENISSEKMEITKNASGDSKKRSHSINSSNLCSEENSLLPIIDQNEFKDKIKNSLVGVLSSKDSLNVPEMTKNSSNKSELILKVSPLKIKLNNSYTKSFDFDKSSNNKKTINLKNSSSKHKLSFKKKVTSDRKSMPSELNSQNKKQKKKKSLKNFSPKKLSKTVSPKKFSKFSKNISPTKSSKSINPKKSKSELSLKVSQNKNNECSFNQKKSSIKNLNNCSDLSKSNRSFIMFTKLGRMSRRRKYVSFLWLGRLKPKEKILICNPNEQEGSNIIIKSNQPANFDYNSLFEEKKLKVNNIETSDINNEVPKYMQDEIKISLPSKDSQALSNKSPNNKDNKIVSDINEDRNNVIMCNLNQLNDPMEIDEVIPSVSKISKHQTGLKEIEDKKCSTSIKKTVVKTAENQNEFINDCKINVDVKDKVSNNNSEMSENDEILNPVKKTSARKHLVYGSSDETESRTSEIHNTQKLVVSATTKLEKNRDRNFDIESNSDSPSSNVSKLKAIKEFRKDKFVYRSSSSSLQKTSPPKNKRRHSESSNDDDDDDDVSSIIDKWCESEQEPVLKKQKTIINDENDLMDNQNKNITNELQDLFADDNDNTLVDNALKKLNKDYNNPSASTSIHKAQSFKENDSQSKKILDMPDLLSADLFEIDDIPSTPSNSQSSLNESNKITSNQSSVTNWSPDKNNVENLNLSQKLSNNTIIDLMQFQKNKLRLSQSSENSNKENNAINQNHVNIMNKDKNEIIDDHIDEIKSSQNIKPTKIIHNSIHNESNIHVPDTLMNITQEQVTFKKIEKALIGVNLSEIDEDKNKEFDENEKFTTPRRKLKNKISNNMDDDFDSDNIDATPVSKKRPLLPCQTPKSSTSKLKRNKPNPPSQDKSLIPAITPMKNTKSYPLSHSTPMVDSPLLENKKTLICSGLPPENTRLVHLFTKKFGLNFQTNFDMKVTHVIVLIDFETKAGQKTFKYIQGIAFKKYVINYLWIIDCLKQDCLLNEDDEKYEVLDPDTLESGSKKSRARTQDLFRDFAFYCHGPFNSFPSEEFENLLVYNGAIIVPTIKALSFQKKYKIVILESENLSQSEISSLKKSQGALISFEWVVDCLSQYEILSLFSYLYEMTVDEVLALGFPSEYLAEEETIEEQSEEEEEQEVDRQKEEKQDEGQEQEEPEEPIEQEEEN